MYEVRQQVVLKWQNGYDAQRLQKSARVHLCYVIDIHITIINRCKKHMHTKTT